MITKEDLAKAILELKLSQAQTDKQIKETSKQMKKTDEQMKKTDEQMKKTDEKLKSMGIHLGNISNN
jgi:uncharacterized coiled-coil protein SlyX